ncbi:protein of unknown function [Azospirillum baldaniorum]|uniref:Uncharacterized protein n=1 Tax=Azospirillum baldaniorum TaxID=1064539 RepID=A0A9P1JTC5_9PROT|nr:protein of unknown function [Azospirillum baldaniorum]
MCSVEGFGSVFLALQDRFHDGEPLGREVAACEGHSVQCRRLCLVDHRIRDGDVLRAFVVGHGSLHRAVAARIARLFAGAGEVEDRATLVLSGLPGTGETVFHLLRLHVGAVLLQRHALGLCALALGGAVHLQNDVARLVHAGVQERHCLGNRADRNGRVDPIASAGRRDDPGGDGGAEHRIAPVRPLSGRELAALRGVPFLAHARAVEEGQLEASAELVLGHLDHADEGGAVHVTPPPSQVRRRCQRSSALRKRCRTGRWAGSLWRSTSRRGRSRCQPSRGLPRNVLHRNPGLVSAARSADVILDVLQVIIVQRSAVHVLGVSVGKLHEGFFPLLPVTVFEADDRMSQLVQKRDGDGVKGEFVVDFDVGRAAIVRERCGRKSAKVHQPIHQYDFQRQVRVQFFGCGDGRAEGIVEGDAHHAASC